LPSAITPFTVSCAQFKAIHSFTATTLSEQSVKLAISLLFDIIICARMDNRPAPLMISDDEVSFSGNAKVSKTANCTTKSYGGYIDYAKMSFDQASQSIRSPVAMRRGPRGGVTVPFPAKLASLLEEVSLEGMEDIISWGAHGRCFSIHKPSQFVSELLPR